MKFNRQTIKDTAGKIMGRYRDEINTMRGLHTASESVDLAAIFGLMMTILIFVEFIFVLASFIVSGDSWVVMTLGALAGPIALIYTPLAIEYWLPRVLKESVVIKFVFGGIISLMIFISHGRAVSDVNGIFSVDASALPHATTVATALEFIDLLRSPSLIVLMVIVFMIFILLFARKSSNGFPTFVITIFGPFLLFVISDHMAHNPARKAKTIYEVALNYDFNSEFNCIIENHQASAVLFIGPDQKNILIAKKSKSDGSVASILNSTIEIEKNIKQSTCSLYVSMKNQTPYIESSIVSKNEDRNPSNKA